jgi:hypothetical protein
MTPKVSSGSAAGAAAAFHTRASGKVIFRKFLRFIDVELAFADTDWKHQNNPRHPI